MINIKPICTLCHWVRFVFPRQLIECRQTGGPHPDLEGLVIMQVWWRIVRSIPIRVPRLPARGWDDLVPLISRGLVEVLVIRPRYPLIRHLVCVVAANAQENGIVNRVIEQRVRNQAAGIVNFLSAIDVAANRHGVTASALGRLVRDKLPLELVGVERLDVAAVVLVEIRELVVQENRLSKVRGQAELQRASRRRVFGARVKRYGYIILSPPECARCRHCFSPSTVTALFRRKRGPHVLPRY